MINDDCPHGLLGPAYCTSCTNEEERRDAEESELENRVEVLEARLSELMNEGGPGRGNTK